MQKLFAALALLFASTTHARPHDKPDFGSFRDRWRRRCASAGNGPP